MLLSLLSLLCLLSLLSGLCLLSVLCQPENLCKLCLLKSEVQWSALAYPPAAFCSKLNELSFGWEQLYDLQLFGQLWQSLAQQWQGCH